MKESPQTERARLIAELVEDFFTDGSKFNAQPPKPPFPDLGPDHQYLANLPEEQRPPLFPDEDSP